MKLFVGNVPLTATEQDIKNFFSSYDIETVKTVKDQATGRNRSFCFVYMPDQNAQKAIDELHNTKFMGSMIVVTHAERSTKRNLRERKDAWKYKHIALPNK